MSTTKTAMLQLSARGPQDEYVSSVSGGVPFTGGVNKMAPFATVCIPLEFNETGLYGKTVTVDIPFQGDLLRDLSLYVKLPALPVASGSNFTGWVNSVGHALIETAEFLVGGKVIEKQPGLFMEICHPFSTDPGKVALVNKMLGRYDTNSVLKRNALAPTEIYVPLQFWFTKRLSAAFPLCLINKHDVRLRFRMREFSNLVTYDGDLPPPEMALLDAKVIAHYVVLNEQTRKEMKSRAEYEIIFEQWQSLVETSITVGSTMAKLELPFNNCVKDVVWVLIEKKSLDNNDFFFFGSRDRLTEGDAFFTTASLSFDGSVRFPKMPESYYRMMTTTYSHRSSEDRNVYTIPFATSVEANHPNGTANFSRFDQTTLTLEMKASIPECMVYMLARAYNVMTIKNGEACLEFVV